MLLATVLRAALSDCQKHLFPAYVGGSLGAETVSCLLYSEEHKLLIVGGQTNSSDFGVFPLSSGFLYALDLKGNWRWGSQYINGSSIIASIDGCQWSSDQETFVVTGVGNSMPIMLDVFPNNGTVKSFLYTSALLADN